MSHSVTKGRWVSAMKLSSVLQRILRESTNYFENWWNRGQYKSVYLFIFPFLKELSLRVIDEVKFCFRKKFQNFEYHHVATSNETVAVKLLGEGIRWKPLQGMDHAGYTWTHQSSLTWWKDRQQTFWCAFWCATPPSLPCPSTKKGTWVWFSLRSRSKAPVYRQYRRMEETVRKHPETPPASFHKLHRTKDRFL